MKKNRLSFAMMIMFAAAAAIAAFVLISGPQVSAESAATVVTGSDALVAALKDPKCSAIELTSSEIYELTETIEISRSLTLNGKGTTINFASGAELKVTSSNKLTVSEISLNSAEGYSITSAGSIVLGERVIFGGKGGILLLSGGDLTSGNAAVTASEGMETLVSTDTSDGIVLIHDLRLTQTKGATDLLRAGNSKGKITLRGKVEILAADGSAIFCSQSAAGPDIAAEDNAILMLSAPKASGGKNDSIPGAALNAPSCSFSAGSGASVGVTGSYCGIAAKNITIGKNATVTVQCESKTDKANDRCAGLSASEKLLCASGAKITIGSSGSNCGTGLYGGQIDLESNVEVIYRGINKNASAIATPGNMTLGAEASLVSDGGSCGIRCAGLTAQDKSTIDINNVSEDGIYASSGVKIGSHCTVDINAVRSAIRAKGEIYIDSETIVNISSAGDAPALWVDSANNLVLSGCTVSITAASSDKAETKAGICSGGGVTLESAAELTVINDGDIGLLAKGGNINISGSSIFRCSGGIGIMSSLGSVLVSENSTLLVEGLLDSGVRIERGSFSLTGGAKADVQGARFGVEAASGDFYIDGAAAFDIRSTTDRAVYIGEGAEVTIKAGCGIHSCGDCDSEHDGIHTFHVGKNARLTYSEVHYGEGEGSGKRILNPQTILYLEEGAQVTLETTQIRGVDDTKRYTKAVLSGPNAEFIVQEKLLTHGKQYAESEMDVILDAENTSCRVISRSVAQDESVQIFYPRVEGNAPCFGHVQCDSIIMGTAKVKSIPAISCNHVDAGLVHEAAIGKIAGDLKLQTLGLSYEEAEEKILEGFLR